MSLVPTESDIARGEGYEAGYRDGLAAGAASNEALRVALEALAKALRESDAWVMAAIECKEWQWDGALREAAILSVKQAHAALAAALQDTGKEKAG